MSRTTTCRQFSKRYRRFATAESSSFGHQTIVSLPRDRGHGLVIVEALGKDRHHRHRGGAVPPSPVINAENHRIVESVVVAYPSSI